ncbi:MAG: nuclear transport factor 2 family protein [Terracidiphilus sp.]|jgi:hypothetical protein
MSLELDRIVFAHVQACEEALLDPEVRRDRERVAELLSWDFVEFGSSGRVWTREQIIEHLAAEDYQPPVIEGLTCDWLADGTVLVTYRTVRANAEQSPSQGQSSSVLRSSIWVMEGDLWRIRFHQGTKVL